MVSDDPIPDLADRLAEWSPGCAVFELINTISNQPAKAIDPASEGDAEPALDELFTEWRAPPLPRRNRSVPASLASRPAAAFPEIQAGRLPHYPFRGLLGVHSRCAPCGR